MSDTAAAPAPKPEGEDKSDTATITIRVRDQVCFFWERLRHVVRTLIRYRRSAHKFKSNFGGMDVFKSLKLLLRGCHVTRRFGSNLDSEFCDFLLLSL